MKKNIKIGLLGFGTVGSAVYRLLEKNAELLTQQLGHRLEIKKIAVRDTSKKRDVDKSLFTKDFHKIVTDPEIPIVIELMGDVPEALEAIKAALSNGKSVVTANKAMIARHSAELFLLSETHNCEILFEASVCGGIPVLRSLREGLAANRILWLRGIINGTSNYILDQMAGQGFSFETVLKRAQELGYAEADPVSDIEGIDAKYKLAILSMLCYGKQVNVDDIYCQGIHQITATDIEMADRFDYAIKLLGITKSHGDGIEARVHPAMVPKTNPLAHVSGVANAVQYHADFAGTGMLYGAGAGGKATASAVVSDLMELARNLTLETRNVLSPIGFKLEGLTRIKPKPMADLMCGYYLRFTTIDKPSVLAQIAGVLGQNDISISSVYQRSTDGKKDNATIVILTHCSCEQDVQAALNAIDKMALITQTTQLIRIEDEE